MNELLVEFSMCFSFLYLIEGIEICIQKKGNKAYRITHILYPLFMTGAMIYFLSTGVLK